MEQTQPTTQHIDCDQTKVVSDVQSHVSTLYDLAYGLRYMYKTMQEDGHGACVFLRMTSDRLMDIASEIDDTLATTRVDPEEETVN